MKNFCKLIGKYFGMIAVLFLILGMTMPQNFTWVVGKFGGVAVLSLLLGVVMFGMGTTLDLKDFALVLKRPLDVFIGACAQFVIMPGLAYLIASAFNLDPALTAGVVLVGTCPGGTSSNVITFMSKGDVALSVTMTSVSTVLSPILTPFITYQLIGERIAFDPVGMFWSIVQIVIVPICLGLAVKSFLPKLAATATDYLPAVSAIAISLIIAGVIAVSRDNILRTSGTILLVVILHNCLGYTLGFILARLTGMSWKKAIALSVEVGMQNSGLATGLAKAHFASMPMATVPGAIFSAWHNISGAVLAWIFINFLNPKFDPEYTTEETVK
jgi:BASS family bile acid:Na+ symporter